MRRLGASLTLTICDGNTAYTDEGHVDRPGCVPMKGCWLRAPNTI